MPPELNDERVAAICQVLIHHGMQFVIIGGMAVTKPFVTTECGGSTGSACHVWLDHCGPWVAAGSRPAN